MKNKELAAILVQIGDLEDVKDQPFKARAYQRAARVVEGLKEDIAGIADRGELLELPGIGKALAKKIEEYVKTGKITYLERLKAEFPPGLLELLDIPGVGPKTVKTLYQQLGVTSIEELEQAARKGRIRKLRGFSEKSEENILNSLRTFSGAGKRVLLGLGLPLAEELIEVLKTKCHIGRISVAGSARRMRETVGDLDILVASDEPEEVMKAFTALPGVEEVIVSGPTKTSVIVERRNVEVQTTVRLQTDLRVVDAQGFGSALQYFTGSKDHNIRLRRIAQTKDWKLNEYGLFEGEKRIAGETEEGVYEALGMDFIAPELREDRGEIEAAQSDCLPKLIRLDDVKGDLHVHTEWSDGTESIERMVEESKTLGYSYVGIADHSRGIKIAGGLDDDVLLEQVDMIKELNGREKSFRIFSSNEVNIKVSGELDYDDEILKELDIVIGAVHSQFKMEKERMTERIVTAMENEHVDFISHPTGRLIGKREPYELDIDKILDAALETSTALEINSWIDRLDLNDRDARLAKERGVKLVLGTDAHTLGQMDFMKFGVGTARRAWLEPEDVLNTLPAKELLAWFKT
ncbi:MAG: DNA polymerase/3'-5' exonuclease PolX [Candidatus Thermoplasmatota archaeon]|nr:DNA polymerase/3'-5' exonuclease PolX [Candidatus Thermoplasmatota archaeon]